MTRSLASGTPEEGRTAFDAARKANRTAATGTAARLSSGETLAALPLDGINDGLAYLLAQIYAAPTRPDAEYDTLGRLPFRAYLH